MKISDIFTIKKADYGTAGKRRHYHAVTRDGDLVGTGPTRKDAERNAVDAINAAMAFLGKTRVFWARNGAAFIVRWNNGWGYEIVRPGETTGSSTWLNERGAFEQACEIAKKHAENYE